MASVQREFLLTHMEAVKSPHAPNDVFDGTNQDYGVAAFDDTTEEFRHSGFMVPADIDTSGTVTFRAWVMAATAHATNRNVKLRVRERDIVSGDDGDQTMNAVDSSETAVDATQDDFTEVTWTETVSNLGWAARDWVHFEISRITASTTPLSGDLLWRSFVIDIPLS